MNDKKIELLKKLKALAERGEGGEKEGAEKKLRDLMDKYGIDELEFDEEKVRKHEIKYKGAEQRKILIQTAYKIFGNTENIYRYTTGKGSRNTLLVECTEAQMMQLRIEFEFYKDLWEEELGVFLSAFVQKHELFGTGSGAEEDYTEEKKEEIKRMFVMMQGMRNGRPERLIEG